MAKNKKNDIDSFSGMFNGTAEHEQIEGQETIETLEGGKYMPEPIKAVKEEKKTVTEPKKRGRPKVNRETKKRISFTILPSLYDKASEIAYNEGKSVSELVSDFLTEYVQKHS